MQCSGWSGHFSSAFAWVKEPKRERERESGRKSNSFRFSLRQSKYCFRTRERSHNDRVYTICRHQFRFVFMDTAATFIFFLNFTTAAVWEGTERESLNNDDEWLNGENLIKKSPLSGLIASELYCTYVCWRWLHSTFGSWNENILAKINAILDSYHVGVFVGQFAIANNILHGNLMLNEAHLFVLIILISLLFLCIIVSHAFVWIFHVKIYPISHPMEFQPANTQTYTRHFFLGFGNPRNCLWVEYLSDPECLWA